MPAAQMTNTMQLSQKQATRAFVAAVQILLQNFEASYIDGLHCAHNLLADEWVRMRRLTMLEVLVFKFLELIIVRVVHNLALI